MRTLERLALGAGLVVAATCAGNGAPTASSSDVVLFTLVAIDGTRLPGKTAAGPYITQGLLALHDNGTFSEELMQRVTVDIGANEHSSLSDQTETGLWLQLPGGRFELRYADQRPVIVDTTSSGDAQFTKRCAAFTWCGTSTLTYSRQLAR